MSVNGIHAPALPSTRDDAARTPSNGSEAALAQVPPPEVMKVPSQMGGPKPMEEKLDTLYSVISQGRITVADLIRRLAGCPDTVESHTEAFQASWKDWGRALFWILNGGNWDNGSARLQSKMPKEDRNVENVYVVYPWG
jgi:hypothetical protein